ncbi:hypothetical protein EDD18DRAFT_1360451 [Armillaria luteobubalina]|uniref:Uncharacterized protein n=1 Tax=Armillaria luteobubalina TaxID=153913 RepID=A0AA39PN78_9AGAR|nr:hypothetical protein EDD18DRAFT_1360451 [Armillaria luteobubalina]
MQTDIPLYLTNIDKALIFQVLDVNLNSRILHALLHDLAFTIQYSTSVEEYYFDAIAGIAKGVAPTLLVGRAAAGHTRPREDGDGSTVSSLHFQTTSAHSTTSSQFEESTVQSLVLVMDIEAQLE